MDKVEKHRPTVSCLQMGGNTPCSSDHQKGKTPHPPTVQPVPSVKHHAGLLGWLPHRVAPWPDPSAPSELQHSLAPSSWISDRKNKTKIKRLFVCFFAHNTDTNIKFYIPGKRPITQVLSLAVAVLGSCYERGKMGVPTPPAHTGTGANLEGRGGKASQGCWEGPGCCAIGSIRKGVSASGG